MVDVSLLYLGCVFYYDSESLKNIFKGQEFYKYID